MQVEQLSLFDDFDTTPSLPCPFLGRKVTVTGSFTQGRQFMRSTLLRLGASEVNYDRLQRSTHFLLAGDNPNPEVINYWQLYVHDGYNIHMLSADDLMRIQGGDYAPYQMPEEMAKDLRLTSGHLYWVAPEISGLKNQRSVSPLALSAFDVLYNKEVFVHTSIMENHPNLAQAMGCLGAYANTEMADDTDCILMPFSMPRDICQTIEQYYNSSRATQFNTPFVILEDLLEFLKRRCSAYPDEVLGELLNG